MIGLLGPPLACQLIDILLTGTVALAQLLQQDDVLYILTCGLPTEGNS